MDGSVRDISLTSDRDLSSLLQTAFADANMPKYSRAKKERMREAKRRARAAESDEARDARLARDRASHSRARDEETPEQRAERQALDLQRHKRARERRRPLNGERTSREGTPCTIRKWTVRDWSRLAMTVATSHGMMILTSSREELHDDYKH